MAYKLERSESKKCPRIIWHLNLYWYMMFVMWQELTSWLYIFLEKFIFTQSRNSLNLQKLKFQPHMHKSMRSNHILSSCSLDHISTPFLQVHFIIIFPSMPKPALAYSYQTFFYISHFLPTCHMFCPSYPWFNHPNNFMWKIEKMTSVIMHFLHHPVISSSLYPDICSW